MKSVMVCSDTVNKCSCLTGDVEKGKTTPTSPLPPSPSSAGSHGRTKSEGALHMSQPLPPIKVPSNEKEEEAEGAEPRVAREEEEELRSGTGEEIFQYFTIWWHKPYPGVPSKTSPFCSLILFSGALFGFKKCKISL